MKPGESRVIQFRDGAVVLIEWSKVPEKPLPCLTVLNEQRRLEDGAVVAPPIATVVFGGNVRRLYDLLREYYGDQTGAKEPDAVQEKCCGNCLFFMRSLPGEGRCGMHGYIRGVHQECCGMWQAKALTQPTAQGER